MASIHVNSTGRTPEENWPGSIPSIIVLTLCSLITILTILGNGIVLISVKFRLHARSYSDYFIVSLCLADFFVGLFVMPLMTVHSFYLRWPYDYRLCYIWMSIDFTCSTASFLTLASMALDRYWALTAPYFHLRNRSYSSVIIFIIISWAIPFAIWPSSIVLGHWYSTNDPACLHPARPYIIVILCTFFYYIPLLFMLVCYSRIIVNIKDIEVLIRGTWDSMASTSSNHDSKTSAITTDAYTTNGRSSRTPSTSFSSLRSLLTNYFQRHRMRKSSKEKKDSSSANERTLIRREIAVTRPSSNDSKRQSIAGSQVAKTNSSVAKSSLSSIGGTPHCRPSRQPTTATFTGQKRDVTGEKRFANELVHDAEEEQRLVHARLSTRTSSLPANRCVSYYYYQHPVPSKTITTQAIIEGQNREIGNGYHASRNSLSPDRRRSQSHSSARCMVNIAMAATETEHSSSFDNAMEDEHQRSNRRTQSSHASTPYNPSRYSQRAIAQFMHERHKARLRRNQKASRMLGILLAVFLICWLPFTISYPTMIIYPDSFPSALTSIVFWFGYANSLLNPFLYVYSSRNFRQAILETVCCFVRLRSRPQLRYQWSLRAGHN